MSILNLRGPEFLRLYFTLLGAATVVGLALRWWLRQPADEPAGRALGLSATDVAYLAGGPPGAANAAIARLVHRGTLKVKLGALRLNGNLPRDAGAVERAVYRAVAYASADGQIREIRRDVAPAAEAVGERLEALGLVPTSAQAALVRCAPAAIVLAVAVLGVVKCGVGLSRGRPVEFLVMACFLAFAIAGVFAAVAPRTTRRGKRLLRRLRGEHEALRTTAEHNPAGLDAADLALAFALYGPAVLASGPLWVLREAMKPPRQGGSGCGGDTSGGCGSGSSCGGGGCGGGGGGGCGGCGS